jgi:hypothetical protein
MPNELSRESRRDRLTAATALGLGAFVAANLKSNAQEEARFPGFRRTINSETGGQDGTETPRSSRISEEVVSGGSVVRSPDFNESKRHSLIQTIEHTFKEDQDTAAGFPVTATKEFKIKSATKLAIVTISGFELWFGSSEQELVGASSRYGVHAGLDADFGRKTLTVKVRANSRFWGRVNRDWAWRCRVIVQCFGED